jgi:hypothetical protein
MFLFELHTFKNSAKGVYYNYKLTTRNNRRPMVSPTGTCKLCLTDGPLRKSHIFPEFLFKTVYSLSAHTFATVTSDQNRDNRKRQKGIREPLLCPRCETKLSQWEKYACEVMEGRKALRIEDRADHYLVRGIDYVRFKLFEMSLIWRAGVSSHPNFNKVTLGPHQSDLRNLLYAEDPGGTYDYPCVLTALWLDPNRLVQKAIMLPLPERLNGQRIWFSVAGGLQWIFVVSHHAHRASYAAYYLRDTGELPVCKGDRRLTESILASLRSTIRDRRSERDRK